MKIDYELLPCKKCGNKKEYGYRNGAYCGACAREIRKSKRVYDRKLPHGSGRKPTCSCCGKLKEVGRENESRCFSCKSKAYKENRAIRREEMGLQPLGSGRKSTCCRCAGPKENINKGYCNSCKALNESENRFKKVSTEEGRIAERESWRLKSNDLDFRMKVEARRTLNTYVWLGKIKRQSCEVCGIIKAEAHHDDYMKPLDVRWLCRKHHLEYHSKEQSVIKD